MVQEVERVKVEVGASYRQVCRSTVLAYSSLMRWRQRLKWEQEPVLRPGPKKVEGPDLEQIRQEVLRLRHGEKRTQGTTELYHRYSQIISRRDLQEMVRLVRAEVKREHRALLRRVTWHIPGLVWSLDDTEYIDWSGTVYVHQVRDASSRYSFTPLVGAFAQGEIVAWNLERLFLTYGAPLILKRDNGGNLNHEAVDRLLQAHMVIPLNSPKRYPPYNGGIEQAQNELKGRLLSDQRLSDRERQMAAQVGVNEMNHESRDCLSGRTSCEVLMTARGIVGQYDRRKRKEVYDHITALVMQIAEEISGTEHAPFDTMWRVAVETWLRTHGLITVRWQEKVLPNFPEKWSHN